MSMRDELARDLYYAGALNSESLAAFLIEKGWTKNPPGFSATPTVVNPMPLQINQIEQTNTIRNINERTKRHG